MDHKRRRQLTMIKDKTIEIIELGIKPNLLRLDRISKLIKQVRFLVIFYRNRV